MAPTPIRLLIVDDSAFMRKIISDFFQDTQDIKVVGTARNGKDAIAKISTLQPTVLTMDVEMPEMDGMEALKVIMQRTPLPVIMLSSSTKSGAENTMLAMEYGAVDFIAKPSGTISLDLHKVRDELIEKIRSASTISMSKLKQTKEISTESKVTLPKRINNPILPVGDKIILIGTSTGGPRALQQVITTLPANIAAPILVVQHMPAGFTKSLANRLDQLSAVRVKEAENGDVLEDGTVYIAPGGFHLELSKHQQRFIASVSNEKPPRASHRPSVDVLFESASQFPEVAKIVAIMTGMGSDGTIGLRALKEKGQVIAIAESSESCIVYGMPKAAVESGNVDAICHLEDISSVLVRSLNERGAL
ncbi:protein-glutamate methylesterase/protein-glutamine glutaminase [Paenisporosarcina cavernae]|uniref:Protein-glutamate methylesterase/protein-glutamine glutaminase n=1 Tax=Paenisporosarcina cavernae TaxID=2320858 RepID=A0A385YSA7_9BACL|nr:chemotaxis response regulator protein-glutamate methylesterase [Paenisporosarcina cavernae]AYC29260.1 chemotaxis response regulator protein-glutamate methylesterase [Paenisporosarcina cavernae]